MVQIGFLLFVIMGDTLLVAIGIPVPAFYDKIKQNKWTWAIGAWFIGGQLQSSLLTTGAFEIYVNDVLEYSKIATGKMPDTSSIHTILTRYNVEL